MTYFIKTYGCQMNIHESEKVAGILSEMGYQLANEESKADVLVFNTCCIRETAEHKIIGNLGIAKNYKKHNPNMIIILLGCMTQQDGALDNIRAHYPYVDIVLGTTNLDQLAAAVVDATNKKKTYNNEMQHYAEVTTPVLRTSMPNAWVNIIYGCNNFCTYCIVPYVRGREESRPMAEIVAQIKQLVSDGYKEITLLGQNVNSYGNDLNDGSSFAKLLRELGSIETPYRLRFMSNHPKDLTDEVIDVMAEYPNICKYIHLPVQSGSSNVLKAMNRRYNRDQYLALIEKIRAKIPEIGITSDIMVGFPTETEEDFQDTLDLVRKVKYSTIFAFIYNQRTGTPACEMPQVPYEIKQRRIAELLDVQAEITTEYSNEMIGNDYEILVEGVNDKHENTYCGRTESGRLVNVESQTNILNEMVTVTVESARGATLWGRLKGGN